MDRRLWWLLVLAAVALLCGCGGGSRRYGDPDGVPVAFAVHLDRAFVRSMDDRRVRPSVGAGAGWSSSGATSWGTGLGLTFTATTIHLLGGDGPGQAQGFRQELTWGDNAFTATLRRGRTLTLTLQASGGREGWESLGSIVVPDHDQPRVTVRLEADGAHLTAD